MNYRISKLFRNVARSKSAIGGRGVMIRTANGVDASPYVQFSSAETKNSIFNGNKRDVSISAIFGHTFWKCLISRSFSVDWKHRNGKPQPESVVKNASDPKTNRTYLNANGRTGADARVEKFLCKSWISAFLFWFSIFFLGYIHRHHFYT